MACKLNYVLHFRTTQMSCRHLSAAFLNLSTIRINRNTDSVTTALSKELRKNYSASTNVPSIIKTENKDDELSQIIEEETEDLIEMKRNKSGLNPFHYSLLHKKMPDYTEDELVVMELWKYRKLYGRYGSAAKVNIENLWPSEQEMELHKEKEKVEYPHTVQEMIMLAKEAKHKEEEAVQARQNEIVNNMKLLEKWKADIRNRIEKREREVHQATALKKKQVEEVRQIFGYHISPNDPKFQEALEKKMAEDKIKAKKEKKLIKHQKLIDRLKATAKEDADNLEKPEEEDSMMGKRIE